jgi:rhomboid family protein
VIPLRDENPTSRPAIVTIAIIGACVLAYFLWQPTPFSSSDEDVIFFERHAAIPDEVVERRPLDLQEVADDYGAGSLGLICEIDPTATQLQASDPCVPDKNVWLAVVVSMFLHGSIVHIAGNLLFLWVFGNNVEDRLGPVFFTLFYLAGGVVAALAHIAVDPNSTVPVVGASGAIAAVMGAYLVWYPYARVQTLFFVFFIFWFRIPAAMLLGVWFVLQFFTSPNSGVAWVAHVGGFLFGVVVGLLVGRPRRPAPAYYI